MARGRKLSAVKVLEVISSGGPRMFSNPRFCWSYSLRQIEPYDGRELDHCHFAYVNGRLYLPKRKRGQRFRVRYLELKEVEL